MGPGKSGRRRAQPGAREFSKAWFAAGSCAGRRRRRKHKDKQMNRKRIGAGVAGLLAAAGAAHAGSVYQSGMLATAATNWSTPFQIQQFDDMGGARVLEAVVIDIVAQVDVTARAENRDRLGREITLNMGANLSLKLGDDTLVVASPTLAQTYFAGGFDGAIDFGGASGVTYTDLMEMTGATTTLSLPADDLSQWIGGGLITLTGVAEAFSFVDGGGNLTSQFQTQAAMEYMVEYIFRGETVPTPTAAGLGLAGLGGLAGFRRRRPS